MAQKFMRVINTKNSFWVIRVFVLIALVCTILKVSASSADSLGIESNGEHLIDNQSTIENLLTLADNHRTSSSEKFSKILRNLGKLQTEFSQDQRCYFEHLLSHELALRGEYETAKSRLKSLFSECLNVNIRVKIKIALSIFHVIARDYEIAIDDLDYVIEHINQLEDKKMRHSAYNGAAIVYRLVNQDALSLKFSELILNDSPNKTYKCKGNTGKYIIILKTRASIDDSVINLIYTAIEECEDVGELIYSNFIKLGLLDYQLHTDKINGLDARSVLEQLKLFEKEIMNISFKNLIGVKNALFAKTYWVLGDRENALSYALKTLQNSRSIGNPKQKIVVLQILIDYYQLIGDHKTAFQYLVQKNESEKISYGDEQAKLMAFQTVKHENMAKSHQIELLNQKNEVLTLENELADKNTQNQQLLILFLSVVTAFFLFWGYKNKKQQIMYKKLSERDFMTNVYNRKGLKDYVEKLLSYSKSKKQHVAFSIFDLDHFKKINDQYGHSAGDWVIENVIKVCKEFKDERITFGRLGGEEFAIVMRDSSQERLAKFANTCCQAISELNTAQSGFVFQVTASFGITSTANSGYVYSSLLTQADEAMYQAKAAGRNQVVTYEATG